jgi:hypothetical protein
MLSATIIHSREQFQGIASETPCHLIVFGAVFGSMSILGSAALKSLSKHEVAEDPYRDDPDGKHGGDDG